MILLEAGLPLGTIETWNNDGSSRFGGFELALD